MAQAALRTVERRQAVHHRQEHHGGKTVDQAQGGGHALLQGARHSSTALMPRGMANWPAKAITPANACGATWAVHPNMGRWGMMATAHPASSALHVSVKSSPRARTVAHPARLAGEPSGRAMNRVQVSGFVYASPSSAPAQAASSTSTGMPSTVVAGMGTAVTVTAAA